MSQVIYGVLFDGPCHGQVHEIRAGLGMGYRADILEIPISRPIAFPRLDSEDVLHTETHVYRLEAILEIDVARTLGDHLIAMLMNGVSISRPSDPRTVPARFYRYAGRSS